MNYLNVNSRQRGFSLVEVMVALFIGVFLLAGALTVYANSRATIETTAKLNMLQDNARYAFDMIEPDLRSAGFWGMTNSTEFVDGRASPADPIAIVVTDDCGINWSVDLDNPVAGSDNVNPFAATCLAGLDAYQDGSDLLTVRHASDNPVAAADLQPGRIYVRADQSHAELFTGTIEPAGFASDALNFELVTHAYYVAPDSDLVEDLPSLRRLELTDGGATPAVVDREILPGVEDMQLQFGIDTDGDSSVNSYVDASGAVDTTQILSVRIWLRMRAESPELDYEDDVRYIYADQDFSAADTVGTDDDALRRLLLSKTIGLRNRQVVSINGG